MDGRCSGWFMRASAWSAAAWLLTACAADVAEVRPTPPSPVAVAPAPAPAPAAPVVAPELPPAPAPAAAPMLPPAPAPAAAPAPPLPSPVPPSRPVEVTGVNVQDAGQGGLRVIVSGDGPIPMYESFTLPDPPRLIVDIPNARHAVPQPVSARLPLITAIRSTQYREQPIPIVRIVLDLRSPLPFQVMTSQNQLQINLGAAVEGRPTAAATPPPTPASGKVTRVDLQSVRGRQQIIIRTSGTVAYTVQENKDPLSLTIDISGALLDRAAARTLDLARVSSPVTRLRAGQGEGENTVRVVADLRGPARYDVHQTASTIVVDFLSTPKVAAEKPSTTPPAVTVPAVPVAAAAPAPQAAPPASVSASPRPLGTGRLSMDFKDADINNLLRIIAEVSGMNVVAGGDVQGKVTVRLSNVDWQQALDVILRINGLGYEIDGNIIRVAPVTKLATEQRAREDAKRQERLEKEAAVKAEQDQKIKQVQQEPLVDEVIAVNYAKASDVVKNLDRMKTPGRPDASIVVDDRTNKLVIRDTPVALGKMKDLLREIDLPTPQVLIEARLVEATRSFTQSLGIEWGFAANATMSSLQSPNPVSIFSAVPGTATLAAPAALSSALPLTISFPGSQVSPGTSVGFLANSLFSNRLALGARITAGEVENKARTLSAPKVATVDNQEAEIKQGTQVPYTTIDSSGRTVVAFQDAFIRLKVTPHITNDRRIAMKVEAERSFPGDVVNYTGGFVYPINTRKATTNVLVPNGATIVIGGLMQSDEKWNDNRVPFLGNVPVLGWLFKSTNIGPDSKVELLIFLTPTILEEARIS